MSGIASLGSWFKKRIDDTGNVASRAFDQVNMFDSGRTATVRQPVNNTSIGQNVSGIVRGVARPFVETADYARQNTALGIANVLGNREKAGRIRVARDQSFQGSFLPTITQSAHMLDESAIGRQPLRKYEQYVDDLGAQLQQRGVRPEVAQDFRNYGKTLGYNKAFSDMGIDPNAGKLQTAAKVAGNYGSTAGYFVAPAAGNSIRGLRQGLAEINRQGLIQGGSNALIAKGDGASDIEALQAGAMGYGAGAALTGVGYAAPRMIPAAKRASVKIKESFKGAPALNFEEKALLKDYLDYKSGTYKPDAETLNKLIRDARAAGDKARIDVVNGTVPEIAERISREMSRQRGLFNDEAGYIRLPGNEEVNRPLYHGSPAADQIRKEGFKSDTGYGSNGNGQSTNLFGKGTYLTSEKSTAKSYGKGLNKNVLRTDIPKDARILKVTSDEAMFSGDKYAKQGYDGLEINNGGKHSDYVIFEPSKVKVLKDKTKIKKISNLTDYEMDSLTPTIIEHWKDQGFSGVSNGERTLIFNELGKVGRSFEQIEADNIRLIEAADRAIAENKAIMEQLKNEGGYVGGSKLPDDFAKIVARNERLIREADKAMAENRKIMAEVSQPSKSIWTDEGGGMNAPKNSSESDAMFGPEGRNIRTSQPRTVRLSEQQVNGQTGSLPPTVPQKRGPTRTEFADEAKLNTGRLNLDDRSKAYLDQETIEVVGKLSNEEVKQMAKDAGLDTKSYSIDQTRRQIAKQLNVRQQAVSLLDSARSAKDSTTRARLYEQAAEAGRISRTQGTDLGRQLQARKIIADKLATPEMRIFRLLDEAGVNPKVYTKRFAEIDFKDTNAVVKAYRELVPGKFTNWLDTVRYNSMLSSPLTQAVNIFGNAQNVGIVAPIEKTIRGGLDAIGGLFGKQRQYAAGEGAAYLGGSIKALGEARDSFVNALRGKNLDISNPDLGDVQIPLAKGGAKGATYQTLSFPMRVLDAFDKFYRTLGREGETAALNLRESKGIKIKGSKEALAESEAAYRVFQADSNIPGQGILLNGFDGFADLVLKARNHRSPLVSYPAKFTVPFVKTINNISKQGIAEYSPLGFVNMVGNADKTTALTRAMMGTAVFGAAGAMLGAGDLTWSEPRDPELRAAFRAEGKQQYSLKIGGKWYQFSKLAPSIAFPFALTAGIKDAVDNKKMTESTMDGILQGVAKWGEFLSDQSYAKSIGDTLAATKGDTEKIASAVSNYPQQLVPFRALTGWLARLSDDTDRKVNTDTGYLDQQVQQLMLQYPGLRDNVDARIDPYTGEALAVNNNTFNQLSPVKITNDKGFGNTDGLNLDQREMNRDLPDGSRESFRRGVLDDKALKVQVEKERKAIRAGKEQKGITIKTTNVGNADIKQISDGSFYAQVGGEYKTFKSKDKAEQAIFVDNFKNGDKKLAEFGNKVYLKADNDQGYTSLSKVQYEFNQEDSKLTLEMDRAKSGQDLERWASAADSKYQAMNRLRESYDPDTEADKIADLTLKMENLREQADKYLNEYGGFTKAKGKKSRSLPSISTAPSQELSGPVVTSSSVRAPSLRLSKTGSPSVRIRRKSVKIKAPKRLSRA